MTETSFADTPEQQARKKIDALLSATGWVIQNVSELNRNASTGVAVREFHLPSGPCDYLLFVGGKAAGVIEAKKAGTTLSAVSEQSDKYMSQAKLAKAIGLNQAYISQMETGKRVISKEIAEAMSRALDVDPTLFAV